MKLCGATHCYGHVVDILTPSPHTSPKLRLSKLQEFRRVGQVEKFHNKIYKILRSIVRLNRFHASKISNYVFYNISVKK